MLLSGPEICSVPLCTSIVPPSLLKFRGDMIAVPAPSLLRSVPRLMKVSMATFLSTWKSYTAPARFVSVPLPGEAIDPFPKSPAVGP